MSSCKYRFVDLFELPWLLQTLTFELVLAVEIVQIQVQNPPADEVRDFVVGLGVISWLAVFELCLRPWFRIQMENSS
jgi:hypothetical protein